MILLHPAALDMAMGNNAHAHTQTQTHTRTQTHARTHRAFDCLEE
jgi:hypothetical protein